jgi:MFS superfamily sulfate permease-like transporter
VLCVAAGAARLGVIADLMSLPVRVGFLNGIAVVIITSQLPRLFGFTVGADGVVDRLRAFVEGVADGDTNATALAIGLACLALIVGLRSVAPRVPGVLIAVVGAAVVVRAFDLTERGVPVVGAVPSGFARPALPSLHLSDVGELFLPAVAIAFVTLADTTALSRAFAHGRATDPNREMAALGAANLAGAFFRGFPVSASASRTSVALASGARTQLTGLVAAAAIAAIVVGASGTVHELPSTALAAVVIAAGIAIFDVATWRRLLAVRRSELVLSLIAFLGVILVGVLEGVAVAAALSLVEFVRRAWRPYNVVLGRVEGRKGYHDVDRHPEAEQIPQLVLYRFDAPLFFANAGYFAARLGEIVAERGEPVRTVVVAAEPITDVDATAAEVLRDVVEELHKEGIALVFAELKGPVKDRLRGYGVYDLLGDDAFPPTLGTAIDLHLERTGVEWVDWEDRVG